MCFRKECIDAIKIDWERKMNRIGRKHSLNFHHPKVILNCRPGGPKGLKCGEQGLVGRAINVFWRFPAFRLQKYNKKRVVKYEYYDEYFKLWIWVEIPWFKLNMNAFKYQKFWVYYSILFAFFLNIHCWSLLCMYMCKQ